MDRLLNVPVPVILAAALPQVSTPTGPEWFLGAIAGIWCAIYLIDKLRGWGWIRGKGNGNGDGNGNGNGPKTKGYSDIRAEKVYNLLATRGDDGIERFLKHHQMTVETHEIVRALAKNTEAVMDLLEASEERSATVAIAVKAMQEVAARQDNCALKMEQLTRVVSRHQGGST